MRSYVVESCVPAGMLVIEAVGAEILCPGYHRKKCRFERPLAERRTTGTDPVKSLDTLFGDGGYVISGAVGVAQGPNRGSPGDLGRSVRAKGALRASPPGYLRWMRSPDFCGSYRRCIDSVSTVGRRTCSTATSG